MIEQLAFERIFPEPGKTFSVAPVPGNGRRTMNAYVPSTQRVVFAVAACVMSALTLSLTVIAPAQLGPASPETRVLAATPTAVTPSLDERPTPQMVTEGAPARCVL